MPKSRAFEKSINNQRVPGLIDQAISGAGKQ